MISMTMYLVEIVQGVKFANSRLFRQEMSFKFKINEKPRDNV